MILQREVEDSFRGRVFAAELALLTLTMAASNYITGDAGPVWYVAPFILNCSRSLFPASRGCLVCVPEVVG